METVTMKVKPVMMIFRCHGAGDTRVLKADEAYARPIDPSGVPATRDQVIISKRLLDCAESRAMRLTLSRARSAIEKMTQPSFLTQSMYAVNPKHVTDVEEEIAKWVSKLSVAITALGEVYQERIRQQSKKLGVHYRKDDYLPWEIYRDKWWFEYRWVQFDTPAVLEQVDTALWQRERERAAESLDNAARQMRLLLREQFLTIIRSFRNMIEPGKNGKTKKFTARSVNALNAFRSQFNLRDLTGDDQLDALMGELSNTVTGLTSKSMKDDDVRQAFDSETRAILQTAEGLVQDVTKRRIRVAA